MGPPRNSGSVSRASASIGVMNQKPRAFECSSAIGVDDRSEPDGAADRAAGAQVSIGEALTQNAVRTFFEDRAGHAGWLSAVIMRVPGLQPWRRGRFAPDRVQASAHPCVRKPGKCSDAEVARATGTIPTRYPRDSRWCGRAVRTSGEGALGGGRIEAPAREWTPPAPCSEASGRTGERSEEATQAPTRAGTYA